MCSVERVVAHPLAIQICPSNPHTDHIVNALFVLLLSCFRYIAGRHSSPYAGCEEWVDNWVGGSSGRPGLRSGM
ncbi:hypothetical protein BDQ94DRAFT_146611 [Aspergillus welwitschiae]|uniref:Uncharacterized protein n=1 Tax=Aspergillus welwitschiae TaxID=1341132 RepID=A0A3F3PXW6_9EURO|nr:hypothetical protein BDQ94DRAFT_146611 [Aspergillus welwitschiae]RDH31759.1 hypothetical protein BDQ94DRAFT_146611 [Aspergillus welwitschiae]